MNNTYSIIGIFWILMSGMLSAYWYSLWLFWQVLISLIFIRLWVPPEVENPVVGMYRVLQVPTTSVYWCKVKNISLYLNQYRDKWIIFAIKWYYKHHTSVTTSSTVQSLTEAWNADITPFLMFRDQVFSSAPIRCIVKSKIMDSKMTQ